MLSLCKLCQNEVLTTPFKEWELIIKYMYIVQSVNISNVVLYVTLKNFLFTAELYGNHNSCVLYTLKNNHPILGLSEICTCQLTIFFPQTLDKLLWSNRPSFPFLDCYRIEEISQTC